MPRVIALQGVAVDVPARKVGEESAREKASVRQRGMGERLSEGR